MIWFVPGLVALVAGAELLVRGASRLALSFGVSPLVVGLTVVAFGTSAPELAVSVDSALAGRTGIALGNVVGSNVFNVLFILGVSALVTPLAVHRQIVRQEVPVLIGVGLLLWALALDGSVGRLDGLVFASMMAAYTTLLVRQGRREDDAGAGGTGQDGDGAGGLLLDVAMVLAGLGLLVLGADWFVGAAVLLAREAGMSETVVGLTIVAAGTSLPEVATSVMAAVRGERDIAVGNVVGSNLFNILAVLGVSAIVAPSGLQVPAAILSFDLPVMVAVSAACLPVFFTGHLIARWEGALFLAYYVAYTAWLVLDATGHEALGEFSAAMTWFVLPLTATTLAVFAWRHARERG